MAKSVMPEAPTMAEAAAICRECWHIEDEGFACKWCILIGLGEVRAAEGQRAYQEWLRAEALKAWVAELEARVAELESRLYDRVAQ